MSATNPTECTRVTHLEGFDELITHTASKKAVDTLFIHLKRIFEQVHTGGTMRILLDSSQSGEMPLNHVFRHTRDLIRNGQKPTRAAILSRPTILTTIVSNMINSMGLTKTRLRFFNLDQRQAAIEWLLQNDE